MKRFSRTLRTILAAGALALSANAAWAIPFTVNVDSTLAGLAGGEWNLEGPTELSDNWAAALLSSYSSSHDIAAGNYAFAISGAAAGFGSIAWTLHIGDTVIGPNGIDVLFFRIFEDGTTFVADSVSVPEPGSLALLAIGGLSLLLARRRRAV